MKVLYPSGDRFGGVAYYFLLLLHVDGLVVNIRAVHAVGYAGRASEGWQAIASTLVTQFVIVKVRNIFTWFG